MIYQKELARKTNLDYINQIWLAIMQMNISALHQLLKDDIDYEDVSKVKFIDSLSDNFQQHKSLGDSEFKMDLSVCNGCVCNQSVCKFIGNNSGNHFALYFEIKAGTITDIFHCNLYGNDDCIN